MVDGLQPSGDEATLARRAADRDPRAVAARFFRVMEFAEGGSTPKIREDIIKLPPAVVAQLSRATRAFELTIIPRATPLTEQEFFDEMGIISGEEVAEPLAFLEAEQPEIVQDTTISEVVHEVDEPIIVDEPVVDTVPTNPLLVFEADGTSAPEIEAKIVLKNLFGDVSDLSLTIADAPVIATFLVSKVEKPSHHPWLQIVQERFENVPVEDIAKKYDFSSPQNFRVALSIFFSAIKKIAPEQLKAELIPLLSPRTVTPIAVQAKTERKPFAEKVVVEQKIEEQQEEVEEKKDPQEMMATYAQVLELNDEQQAALLYFLGIDENTPPVQHDEVLGVVNTLRLKIKETFKTLSDPKLGLNQRQRRALYPTLGWYVQGGTDIVKFQDPKYVRKYAMAGRQNVDIELLDDAHSAYEQVAKALSA